MVEDDLLAGKEVRLVKVFSSARSEILVAPWRKKIFELRRSGTNYFAPPELGRV
jgi:hypothetical protein